MCAEEIIVIINQYLTLFIKNSENDTAFETLNKLRNSFFEPISLIKQFSSAESEISFTYKLFSDNLYASFPYEDESHDSFSQAFIEATLFARSYYSVMLDNELLIRGALSFGNDYSDENMIFSIGLVKAYVLESEKAIYPRIIIDEELFEKIKKGLTVNGPLSLALLDSSYIKDEKGIYFLNPTGLAKDLGATEEGYTSEELYKGFIQRDMQFALQNFNRMKRENKDREAAKYKWLLDILAWYYTDGLAPIPTFEKVRFSKL